MSITTDISVRHSMAIRMVLNREVLIEKASRMVKTKDGQFFMVKLLNKFQFEKLCEFLQQSDTKLPSFKDCYIVVDYGLIDYPKNYKSDFLSILHKDDFEFLDFYSPLKPSVDETGIRWWKIYED